MRNYDKNWLKYGVAVQMKREARRHPAYTGLMTGTNRRTIDECGAFHMPTGTRLIFTRDEGMHTGGWWKNPDYERCWHLSLSFVDVITGEAAPKDTRLTDEWLEVFYGDDTRYVWAEPPYSPQGKESAVWHYRVFCDPGWSPIIPRGEVYNRDFTERGWLSFSDLKNEHHKALARLEPQPGEQ